MRFKKDLILKEENVIHCNTEEKAKQLLNWGHSIGKEWNSGYSYLDFNLWERYKENTFYDLNDGTISYLDFAEKEGYNILKFEDVIEEEGMIEIIAGKNKKYIKDDIKVRWCNGYDYRYEGIYSMIDVRIGDAYYGEIYINNPEDIKLANRLLEPHGFKVVEPINWDEVEVDTLIYVRDSEENNWKPRYFAKYVGGMVFTFKDGATSYSVKNHNYINGWKYAML